MPNKWRNYIPAPDLIFQQWLNNLTTNIQTYGPSWGITSAQITALTTATGTFNSALTTATSPATRTPLAITAKTNARVTVTTLAQTIAQYVAANAAVSVAAKTAAGIPTQTIAISPVTAIGAPPYLSLGPSTPLQQVVNARPSVTAPASKSLPYGVTQIYLYGKAIPAGTYDGCPLPLIGAYTSAKMPVTWTSPDVGKQAVFYAAWATPPCGANPYYTFITDNKPINPPSPGRLSPFSPPIFGTIV